MVWEGGRCEGRESVGGGEGGGEEYGEGGGWGRGRWEESGRAAKSLSLS